MALFASDGFTLDAFVAHAGETSRGAWRYYGKFRCYGSAESGRPLMMQLNDYAVMLDVEAAVRHVDRGHGVSIVGFCWGGGMALKAACALDLTSSISY